MITEYVQVSSKYCDVDAQRKCLVDYANERKLKDFNIINIAENDNILFQQMKTGDTLVMSCISLLGNNFENIMSSIKQLAERRVYIYSAKEDLSIDTYNQPTLASSLDVCMSVYKGILSLRNSKIQQDLLKQGKPRGCPNNARKGKFILNGHEEVKKYVENGLSYAKIAKKLGCSDHDILNFVRHLRTKNIISGGLKPVARTKHKLDKFKKEIIELFNSGIPIAQIARNCGVSYATAKYYLTLLGLITEGGGVNA